LKVLEENNYYPFGLKHSGYNNTNLANPNYKYKYNGKELQDDFNINLYDYGARNYDPTIGRWFNIDPLAETSRRWSPYTYAYNNPILFIDPDGMEAVSSLQEMWDKTTSSSTWTNNGDGTYEGGEDEKKEDNEEKCCKNFFNGLVKKFKSEVNLFIDQTEGFKQSMISEFNSDDSNTFIEGHDGYTYAITQNGSLFRVEKGRWVSVNSITLPYVEYYENGVGKSVVSLVKNSPKLLKIARVLGKGSEWSKDVNSLLKQLSKGNINPGKGSKHLFGEVHELRGASGARVYFRNKGLTTEILGYSSKSNQNQVINILKNTYGK